MPHLIIDIRSLLPQNTPTGIPEYTKHLLSAMFFCLKQRKRQPVAITLFSSGRETPNLAFLAPYRNRFTHAHIPVPNRVLNVSFKSISRPTIEDLISRATKSKLPPQRIFFAPNLNLFPLLRGTRLVTTFHDLSYERYPELLKRKEHWWHAMVNPRAIASRANAIIAVSGSTRDDLADLYGIPQEKIAVIYSGISSEFQKPPSSLKTRNSKLKTILYLGSQEGRKNIACLLNAFAVLKKKLPARLILAGPPDSAILPCKDIVQLGIVKEHKRLALYQKADLLVYPSLFEGFGFPPLEAMACGVPVIASFTSSLSEATGDAALLAPPRNAAMLAQAMEAMLADESLRNLFIERGLKRARQFQWEKTAEETLKVILA